jgi:hypothetical protein
MAHYAFIDEQNIVTEVIVGNDETTGDWESYYAAVRGQRCVRTSYNGNIRGVYAGIGYRYDEQLDVFVPPSPVEAYPVAVLPVAVTMPATRSPRNADF